MKTYFLLLALLPSLLLIGCGHDSKYARATNLEDAQGYIGNASDANKKAKENADKIAKEGTKAGSAEAKELKSQVDATGKALESATKELEKAKSDNASQIKAANEKIGELQAQYEVEKKIADASAKTHRLISAVSILLGALAFWGGSTIGKSTAVGAFPPALVVPGFVFGLAGFAVAELGSYLFFTLSGAFGWFLRLFL